MMGVRDSLVSFYKIYFMKFLPLFFLIFSLRPSTACCSNVRAVIIMDYFLHRAWSIKNIELGVQWNNKWLFGSLERWVYYLKFFLNPFNTSSWISFMSIKLQGSCLPTAFEIEFSFLHNKFTTLWCQVHEVFANKLYRIRIF